MLQGASTIVWACVAEALDGQSGSYLQVRCSCGPQTLQGGQLLRLLLKLGSSSSSGLGRAAAVCLHALSHRLEAQLSLQVDAAGLQSGCHQG